MKKRNSIQIEKLVYQGDGLGRADGMVYFAPWTAPGDEIAPVEIRKKKNLCEVKSFELIQSGDSRRSAPCPVFGECGGCQWQHVQYQEQLKQKQNIVLEQLRRVLEDAEVLPIVSGPEWQYRNRIQVHVKNGQVGFHKRGSSEIVTAEHCKIADPRLLPALDEVTNKLPGRYEIYLQDDGNPQIRSAEESEERVNSSFQQVNSFLNEKLVQGVVQMLPDNVQKVYDLYAGAGNFTFAVWEAFKDQKNPPEIEIVELSQKLCSIANSRAEQMGAERSVHVSRSAVEDFLRKSKLNKESVVIIDPPRPGLNRTICDLLNASRVQELIYISCNPAALARDIGLLTNYRLSTIQAFDLFPQTYHVETVIRLGLR